jgi:hypothetical protein
MGIGAASTKAPYSVASTPASPPKLLQAAVASLQSTAATLIAPAGAAPPLNTTIRRVAVVIVDPGGI